MYTLSDSTVTTGMTPQQFVSQKLVTRPMRRLAWIDLADEVEIRSNLAIVLIVTARCTV